MRALIRLSVLSLVFMVTSSPVALGQIAGGLLADLPNLKNYEVGRESSYDPSGGNADGRHDWPLMPGDTRVMADIKGAGAITHIWSTIASRDEGHLRNLVLRMYWDGEEHPSVESPIGDFFGLGHGLNYQYSSLPIQIGTDKGLNCFWRMPYGNGARITVTNEGPVQTDAFYYYVNYQKLDSVGDDVGRFHAQYRQTFPCIPGENYVFLEAKGTGHYVGCNLSVHNRAGAWWGEGDDMIYIDGAEEPTLHGTGAEDYFSGAWCYGESAPIEFSNPYFGAPYIKGGHKRGALWNLYRYHIEDPIPFKESIRVTIEHGHNNDRQDDYASVAYWYQTEPHVPFPPLPPAAERKFSPAELYTDDNYWGIVESERWAPYFESASVSAASTEEYGNFWSLGKHLFFNATKPETFTAELPLFRSDAGVYPFDVYYTAGPDYGTCELWMNGELLCSWDGYNKDGMARKHMESPKSLPIKPENNILEIRITGKHADSGGHLAGMDCIRVKPW